jgi:hypothetical protein
MQGEGNGCTCFVFNHMNCEQNTCIQHLIRANLHLYYIIGNEKAVSTPEGNGFHKKRTPYDDGVLLFAGLLAQTEFCDGRLVRFEVICFEVFQKPLAASNHLDKSAAAHVVVLVSLKVLGNFLDTSRQH